jgi:tetratricopeptide (TPR) repeat protein
MVRDIRLVWACVAVCVLTFSVSELSAAEGLWVGKMVITKEPGIRISVTAEDGRVIDLGVLDRVVYPVINEQGPWIQVRQYGVEGWLLKEKAVLLDEAPAYFLQRIQTNSGDDRAWAMRGVAWRRLGQPDRAVQDITESIRLAPDSPGWHNNRGLVYHNKKDPDGAIAEYTEAIRLDPTDSIAHYNRGNAFRSKKEYARALTDYQEAVRLDPRDPNPHNGLAWVWATCPQDNMRDGKRAVEEAKIACELTGYHRASDLGTLAAAYAEAGQFEEAGKWQRKALDDAGYSRTHGEQGREMQKLFAENKPYREKHGEVVSR